MFRGAISESRYCAMQIHSCRFAVISGGYRKLERGLLPNFAWPRPHFLRPCLFRPPTVQASLPNRPNSLMTRYMGVKGQEQTHFD